MIIHKLKIFIILGMTILTGCATSTISNKILMVPVEKSQINTPGVSDTALIQGGGNDWANNIYNSSFDGSNAIFGFTHKSFGESTDYLAAVEGPGHKLIWAKTYGGTNLEHMQKTIITSDSGYLMIGESQSLFFTALKVISPNRPPRPFLVKLDSSGNVQWALTIDTGIYAITDIIETSDHGYIAVGRVVNNSGKEVKWYLSLLKISAQGKELWSYQYDAGVPSFSYNIAKTPDGNLMISGLIVKENIELIPEYNSFILKADMKGNPLWSKKYLIDGEKVLSLTSMLQQDFDGTCILTGINQPNDRKEEIMALKLSNDGRLIWTRSYGYSEPYNFEPAETISGYDQDLLITGQLLENPKQYANRKGTALLIDQAGQLKAVAVIEDPRNPTQIVSAAKLSDGKFRLLGHTSGLQAKYIDLLTLTWAPKKTDKKDILNSGFSQHILQLKEQEIQFKMSEINLKFVQIPISLIQVKILTVDEDSEENK